jgi:sterol 3beta-glucosyltransferase
MRITILTYGSRGDVQPFLPLSLGLMANGHSVKLAAPARFKDLIEEHNIDFVPLAGDPEDLSRQLNNAGYNFIKMLRDLMNHAVQIGADVLQQTEAACLDADLIIHTFAHAVGAHTLAREMNIPDIHIQTFPMFTPTGDYPNVSLPDLKIRLLNRSTHRIALALSVWTAKLGFERVRRRAGLPKRTLYSPFDDDPLRPRTPILCAWSPSVLPTSSDWLPFIHVTGYYFFPSNKSYQPPVELQSFLQSGKAPVCVTFGSMVNRDAEKIDQITRESLKQTANRGIILLGWSKVEKRSSDNLLYLEAAPHDWLLPHCKMVVHHGGAGTTSAALRAGLPNVVVPFTADQPFWGSRVHAIGAGPRPILVTQLSVKKLTQAMVEAGSTDLCERARALGEKLRNEDGVAEAVPLIEEYSNNFHKVD